LGEKVFLFLHPSRSLPQSTKNSMGFIIRLIVSAISILIAAYIIPGVKVDGFWAALTVAIVLGLLNAVVKPILTLLTLPITIFSLGLFLLVINVMMVYLADYFVAGFSVESFFGALLFSFAVSVIGSILGAVLTKKD
jgi:putative membrane protein